MSACKVCNSDDKEAVEGLGRQALDGERSWNSIAKELGYTHHAGLKNHMENHYSTGPTLADEQRDWLEGQINQVVPRLAGMLPQMTPEVQALTLVIIKNLMELPETKPSQQHLLAAVKTVQEITGMKMEQQLMFAYAQQAFAGEMPHVPETPALPGVVIDVGEED